MVTDDLPDSFEQLVAFGHRPDVKIRPVLLRVLVDMFVSKPHHGASDLLQFEEMMAHLLDDADDETRLAVAEKLSLNAHTPPALLDRFMAERGAIAAKVLANAGVATRSLNAAAVFGTTAMALAVARRSDIDGTIVRSLAERPEADVLCALVENKHATIERSLFRYLLRRSRDLPMLAALLADRGEPSGDGKTLFLAADARQRADLILAARRQDLGATGRSLPIATSVETLAAIERAALTEGLEGLDLALGDALNVAAADIQLLIDDRHGEPLALALAAVGVSPQVAARVFILGDPAIGHSFPKVRGLIALVETVSARAAHRLVMAMLGREIDAPRRGGSSLQSDPHARRPTPELAVRADASSSLAPPRLLRQSR